MGVAKGNKRRRRADGELGEEEGLTPKRKPNQHYLKGIYAPQPKHFAAAWPTVRTETFVAMVFGAIQKRGRATQQDIAADTELDDDAVGTALADLVLWTKRVGSEIKEYGVREYFVK